MRWEEDILAEVKALRKDIVEIKIQMGVFRARISLWSGVMASIPILTAVALVMLKG